MPLHYEQQGSANNPTLVFLHGFLGNHHDWYQSIELLKEQFHCITLDLPGHGNSISVQTPLENGFQHCHQLIKDTLDRLNLSRYVLVGYSLGGRIALDYARTQDDPRLTHLILESSHIGLNGQTPDKELRYQHDLQWAQKFATQSLLQSLEQWYQQEVFADLTRQQRVKVVQQRAHNYGVFLANMLLSTSLAKQQSGQRFLEHTQLPISYLFGENDTKFQDIAKSLPIKENIKTHGFNGVGHNIHQQAPLHYTQKLQQILSDN